MQSALFITELKVLVSIDDLGSLFAAYFERYSTHNFMMIDYYLNIAICSPSLQLTSLMVIHS